MSVEKQNNLMTWTLVLFIALLLAIPASFAVKKAKNLEAALAPEAIAGLKANVPVSHYSPQDFEGMEILTPGTRSTMYENAGTALITPLRSNIGTFAAKDFQLVGEAPSALLNTVAANINDPEVVRYVFNNRTVVDAFLRRDDVKKLLNDPQEFYKTASDEAALAAFFNYSAMRSVLNSPKIINTVASTMLMDAVLQTPAVQYFLKNPKSANEVINKSAILTALKNDQTISEAVRKNKRTAPVAAILLH